MSNLIPKPFRGDGGLTARGVGGMEEWGRSPCEEFHGGFHVRNKTSDE